MSLVTYFGMDKQIDNRTLRKRKAKRWTYIVGAVAAFALGYWLLSQGLTASVKRTDILVGEVREGEIDNTISANGIVEPSSEIVLVSPLSAKVMKVVKENGTRVEQGEAILILDTEYTQMEFQRLVDELRLKDNNVVKLKLELEKNIRDIELDDQVKDLQLKKLRASLSDAQRLKTIGGVTQEEVDQAKQNLEIALLEKKKLENELKYRKESIASSVQNEQIQASIQKKRLDELGKKLKNATVHSSEAGVITWLENRIGAQINEGEPLVRLANLSSYSIDASVSDMHSEKLVLGMTVQVEVSNGIEMGEIIQILPAVENNTIRFKVRLHKADSDKLRPKMKVPVRIVTDTKSHGMYIPNGQGVSGGTSIKVFVLEDGQAVARTIETGLRTSDKIEVISGLKVGEKVVLSDMSLYKNKSKLKVK